MSTKFSTRYLSNDELDKLITHLKENKVQYKMQKKNPPTLVFENIETRDVVAMKANDIKKETQDQNEAFQSVLAQSSNFIDDFENLSSKK